MICPHCGEETKDGKSCEKCGNELTERREMEVRYRDFKVTELLDIRMPGKAPVGTEAANPQTDKNRPGDTRKKEKQSAQKRSRLALVAVLIFFAAVSGYYLLKLLLKF